MAMSKEEATKQLAKMQNDMLGIMEFANSGTGETASPTIMRFHLLLIAGTVGKLAAVVEDTLKD